MPPQRVEDLSRWLLDPSAFWRHHPIPSLAADSPAFKPEGNYWLGSTWAPTNAAAAWGFARSGRRDLARRLVRRHLEVLDECLQRDGTLWENYCSEDSRRGSWAGPGYSWTTVGPIALLLEVLIGALDRRLRWHLPDEPGWGAEGIPLGPASVSLRLEAERRISAGTDRPITLELVETDGRMRTIELQAGRHRLELDRLPLVAQRDAQPVPV